MEHIFSLASKYLREHKQHRRYLSIFLCLALLIAAATVALLTREGVAMTKTVSVLSCPFSGVAAHTHNADCYDADGNLVCPLPERALHEHDDSCYTEETVLICGREETPGHVHTEACYTTARGDLICTDTSEEHVHDDSCYVGVAVLSCGLAEGEGAHAHSEACYETHRTLTCGQEEILTEHVHGPGCFIEVEVEDGEPEDAEPTAIPEEPADPEPTEAPEEPADAEPTEEPEEGEKTEDGDEEEDGEEEEDDNKDKPDPEADVETYWDWMVSVQSVTLTGDWNEDLAAIARTQLGYTESKRNFGWDETGRHGYTRYGAWYGLPYSDWCAMFVSFCLHFADIPRDAMPWECSTVRWVDDLKARDMFAMADTGYTPKLGDLVFFGVEENGVRIPGHVGIVSYVGDGWFRAIEGNNGPTVAEFDYALGSAYLYGFGILPEEPAEQPAEEPAEESDSSLVVLYPDEGETLTEGNTNENETPTEAETPVEENNTENETLAEAEAPVEDENTNENETLAEAQTPVEDEKTTENETPAENETLAEAAELALLEAEAAGYRVALELPVGMAAEDYTAQALETEATAEDVAAIEAALTETLPNGVVKRAHVSGVTMLDIAILNADGEAVEPDGDVKVSLTRLASANGPRKAARNTMADNSNMGEAAPTAAEPGVSALPVVHFTANGVELLPVENGSFTTASFSAFAVSYTVDFSYEGYTYSLEGDREGAHRMYLSELFALLGIEEQAGDVVDLRLELIEQVDDTFEEAEYYVLPVEGDWLLCSDVAFNDIFTMTAVMADGTEYLVTVTDAQYRNGQVLISDATLEIDGVTHTGKNGDKWTVYPDTDYKLTLNFQESGPYQFPKGRDTMVVDLPAGMTLKDGESGTFDIPGGLAGTVTGNRYEVKNGKLYITFGPDPTDILTRSSNAHFKLTLTAQFDEDTKELQFNNRVTRDVDVKNDGSVEPSKTGTYNEATGKMDYVLTLKSTGKTENINVSDEISGDALKFVEPITIESSTGRTVAMTGYTHSDKGFNLTIPEMSHGETVTIKYSASVDYSKLDKDMKLTQPDNANTLNVKPGDKEGKTATFEYKNEIKYSNISKANTGTETNTEETETTLTWKIVANDNPAASIAGGHITDKIGWNSKDIMTYATDGEGKVPLTILVTNKDTGVTETRYVNVPIRTDWDGAPQSWTYDIPTTDTEKYTYEITYNTVVDLQKAKELGNFNGVVTNDSTNDHGGSSSGSGVVPGDWGPGGGGDQPGTDDYPAGKSVKKSTREYTDWDIVITLPKGDKSITNLTVVDEAPWHYPDTGSGIDGAFVDTFVKITDITGLDGVDYTVNITENNDNHLKRADGTELPRQVMTIRFEEIAPDSNNDRTVHITVRTKNDPDWIAASAKNTGFARHTNSAVIGNNWYTADVYLQDSTVKKTAQASGRPGWYGIDEANKGDLFYKYEITLSNVTSLPLTLTDTFDPLLEFVSPSSPLPDELRIRGGQDSGTPYWHNEAINDEGATGVYPTFSVSGNNNTLTITVKDLFTQPDGSYYPFYKITYYLRVRAKNVSDLQQKAVDNKGSYKLGNSVVWGELSSHYDVSYDVPGVKKDGWFADEDGNPNNRVYQFRIDANPDATNMGDGGTITLTDTHTENLSVDYTSIKVYDLTDAKWPSYDGNTPGTQPVTVEDLTTALRQQARGLALESWMLQNPEQYLVANPEAKGVSWDFNGSMGTFTLPDERHYVIFYSALISGSGDQSFANEADLEGFISTKSDYRWFDSEAEGGADVYQIQLLKYLYGKTSVGLEGAVFQLFVDDGAGHPIPMTYGDTEYTRGEKTYTDTSDGTMFAPGRNVVGEPITFKTDKNGFVLIKLNQTVHGAQLDEGVHYYLKEIESPAGYKIDGSVEYWSFTLTKDPDGVNYGGKDANGNRQWIYFYYDDILKMSNTPLEENENVTVDVEKKWLGANGEALKDLEGKTAKVQLYRKTTTIPADGTATSTGFVAVKATRSDGAWKNTESEDHVTLDTSVNWKHSWADLPRSVTNTDGNKTVYEYEIREVGTTDGFVTTVSMKEESAQDGTTTETFTVTNQEKPTQQAMNLVVKKRWLKEDGTTEITNVDADSEAWANLPKEIQFGLYRVVSRTPFVGRPTSGGSPYAVKGVLPSNVTYNDFDQVYTMQKESYTEGVKFANLPVQETKNGTTYYYSYYIKEVENDAYTLSTEMKSDTDGSLIITMTNTEKPQEKTTGLTVKKVWKDAAGNEITPDYATPVVTYQIYQVSSKKPFAVWPTSGGTLYDVKNEWGDYEWNWHHIADGTYQIGASNDWTETTFAGLPLVTVDAHHKATYYAYYLEEVDLPDNVTGETTLEQQPDGSYLVTFTNVQRPEETFVEVTKTWTENGEKTDWPENIKVEVALYRNGAPYEVKAPGEDTAHAVTLTMDKDNTLVVFDELPKTDEYGNNYVYTVKETVYVKDGDNWVETATVDGKTVVPTVTGNDVGFDITNDLQSPGKLIVTKSFAGEDVLSDEQKNAITFTVTGPDNFSKTSALGGDGSLFVKEGEKYTWTLDNLTGGSYTVTETGADTTVTKDETTYTRTTTVTVDGGKATTGDSTTVTLGADDVKVEYINKYTAPSNGTGTVYVQKDWANGVEPGPVSVSLYYQLEDKPVSGGTGQKEFTVTFVYQSGSNRPTETKYVYARQNDVLKLIFASDNKDNFSITTEHGQVNPYGGVWSNDSKTYTCYLIIDENIYKWINPLPFASNNPDSFTSGTWSVENTSLPEGDDDAPQIYIDSSLATSATEGIAVPQYQNIIIDSSTDWKADFKNLPIKDDSGKYYAYYIVENGGEAYGVTYSDDGTDTITVKNNNAPTYTELTVKKVWKDQQGNDISDTYNGSAEFKLVQVKTTTITSGSSEAGSDSIPVTIELTNYSSQQHNAQSGENAVFTYQVTFSDDAQKKRFIENRIDNKDGGVKVQVHYYSSVNPDGSGHGGEKNISYYPSIVSGREGDYTVPIVVQYTIPITATYDGQVVKAVSIKEMQWSDTASQTLTYGPVVGTPVTTTKTSFLPYQTFEISNADPEWTKIFSNLPLKSADGKTTYQYYVEEINVPDDWTVAYSPDSAAAETAGKQTNPVSSGTLTVTNTVPTPNTVDVAATKTWDDAFDWHPALSFTLYRKTVNAADPADLADSPIPRTEEEAKAAGYVLVSETADDFVNPRTVPAGLKPAEGDSKPGVSWTGLPEKPENAEDGVAYRYLVLEGKVPGYSLKEVTLNEGVYAFTNTPDTLDLTVEKQWLENGVPVSAEDLASLPAVTFKVMRVEYTDALCTQRVQVSGADKPAEKVGETGTLKYDATKPEADAYGLKATVKNLPKYSITGMDDETKAITYTYYSYYVEEVLAGDGTFAAATDENAATVKVNDKTYSVSYRVGDGPTVTLPADQRLNMGADAAELLITNATNSIDIRIRKVNQDGAFIGPAVFCFQKFNDVEGDERGWKPVNLTGHLPAEPAATDNLENGVFTVTKDQAFVITGLTDGIYRAVELEPPKDHRIVDENPVLFRVAQGVLTPLQANVAEYVPADKLFLVANDEITEATASKVWQDAAGNEIKPEDIAKKIGPGVTVTFALFSGSDEQSATRVPDVPAIVLDGVVDTETVTVTYGEAETTAEVLKTKNAETAAWVATFSDLPVLPAGESYFVREIAMTKAEGFTALESIVQSGGEIVNKQTTTHFEFTKQWRNNGATVAWPEGTLIQVTLGRKADGVPEEPSFATYTITKTPAGFTFVKGEGLNEEQQKTYPAIERKTGEEDTFVIPNLNALTSDGKVWTYYIKEETVTGYNTFYYFLDTDGVVKPKNENTDEASTGQYIVNVTESSYELPSTGGSGTGAYRLGGITLMSTALYMLLKRRRSWAKGGGQAA